VETQAPYLEGGDIVYHGSATGGLQIIMPHVSSHGKTYVYATKDKALSLLFMARWNDFIFNVAYGDDGVLEVTERYPNAFDQVYRGKSGYLYELAGEHFQEGLTGFEGEVVSARPEKVLREMYVSDLYSALTQLIEGGTIRLRIYPDRHPDIPEDDSDLVEEALHLYNQGHKHILDYCIALHPALKSRLKPAD